MADAGTLKVGSTFTGAGGLDMALSALWPDAELAWFSEDDDYAAAVFAHHHPDVPNVGDVTAVDWSDVEPVDVLVGGFPCQDISHAGRQAGIEEGTRSGLWFELLHAAVQLGSRLLLLENVAAITSAGGGLGTVLGSLAEVGWDAEWTCLRASDVGAPHRRDRWFAVAWPADSDLAGLEGRHSGVVRERGGQRPSGPGGPPADVDLLPTPTAHDDGKSPEAHMAMKRNMPGGPRNRITSLAVLARADFRQPEPLMPTPRATRGGSHTETRQLLPTPRSTDGPKGGPGQVNGRGVPDSLPAIGQLLPTPTAQHTAQHTARNATAGRSPDAGPYSEGWTLDDVRYADKWAEYGPAIARWERTLGRQAPSPTDGEGRLSAQFVEWMMGWPDGWTDVADTSRNQRLKMLGNGVVPHQAAHAYRHLLLTLGAADG